MITLKPIIRIPGSKFKKLKIILEKLNLPKDQKFKFLDLFGGSLIVGVNVLHNFNNAVDVIINDYDGFWNTKKHQFNQEKIIKTQQSYSGFGNPTKAAIAQFEKRIQNGYFEILSEWNILFKTKIDNQILKIKQEDYKDLLKNNQLQDFYIYIDPPYYGDKYEKLYPNKVDHNELFKMLKQLAKNNYLVISINDVPYVRETFRNWKIQELAFTYTLTSNHNIKKTKELLISNY
ncbi:hypothetical protein ACW95P_04225 [Candidatus Mycoplasma pogonae]